MRIFRQSILHLVCAGRSRTGRRVRLMMAVLVFSATAAAQPEQVVCHYTYGGETKDLVAEPASSPYTVQGIPVGSYFFFRVVFRNKPADIASIKIYTYANRDDGPVLIHQAIFPYPPLRRRVGAYGFSGLQIVYESTRDGELKYWCAMAKSSNSAIPTESARAAIRNTKAAR